MQLLKYFALLLYLNNSLYLSLYLVETNIISLLTNEIPHLNLLKKWQKLRTTQSNNDTKQDGSYCFYNILNPSNKIQCDQCKREISKTTKVLIDDEDYCVSCFSNLPQFPEEYNVINKLDYPVFDPQWTADEELMLCQGLEKHGFGNWSEIAQLIGTNKSRQDVEEHYVTYFLDSPDFIPTGQVITSRNEQGKLFKTGTELPIKKFQRPMSRIFSANSAHSFQRGSLTVNQANAGMKAGSNPAQIVGYMPKRGDFQVEFDNDAELLLAEMEFNQDDSQEQKKMKFRLIDIYNHKLNERIRRKQFVISRKLLDLKQQMKLDKNRTKEQKQIYNMMKVFARFSTPEEHDQLVQGIIKEKQIRFRLQELKELKKKGFRNLTETSQDLENKKKRDEKRKRDQNININQKKTYTLKSDRNGQRGKISSKKLKNDLLFKIQWKTSFAKDFKISPQNYVMIKQILIRESLKQGIIELEEAEKMFKIQRNAVQGIFDFLVQKEELMSSWIEKDSQQSF